jgi:hypothetical protein
MTKNASRELVQRLSQTVIPATGIAFGKPDAWHKPSRGLPVPVTSRRKYRIAWSFDAKTRFALLPGDDGCEPHALSA